MKDSRAGESLWIEWSGSDLDNHRSPAFIFYTEEHVDVENEVVLRALASSIQRNGIAETLGQAFKLLGSITTTHGYAGEVDGDNEFTICNKNGETFHGDEVDKIIPITWVEINE